MGTIIPFPQKRHRASGITGFFHHGFDRATQADRIRALHKWGLHAPMIAGLCRRPISEVHRIIGGAP